MAATTPVSSGDLGEELKNFLCAEQLSLLTSNRADQYAGIATAGITIFVLWHIFPDWELELWFGISCIAVLSRAYLSLRYTESTRDAASLRSWARILTIGNTLTGLLWGITGAAILLCPTPSVIFFIIFMTGGMTAAGATGDAAYRPAMLGFALAAELPVIGALLIHPAAGHAVFAALLTFFTLLLLNASLKFNRAFADNSRMRFGQNELLTQVQSSESAMGEAQQLAMAGNWVRELETNIISLSPEAYGIFGIDPANRAPDFSLIMARVHADDKALVDACVAASMNSAAVASLDHRLVMDNYTIKYLHISAKTIFDASGQPIRVTGSVQDVTDRRLTEERLQFSNSVLSIEMSEQQLTKDRLQFANILLETQMEASPDGIHVVNAQREMIAFNQHFAEIWRVPQAGMKTGNDAFLRRHMIAQVKSPESYAARIQYLLDHPDQAAEDDVLLADGRTLERHTRPLRAADGQNLGRVWFYRDITARQLVAQKLEFANILLETQMEASPDGILVVDTAGKIIAVNQRYAEVSQTGIDDLQGRDCSVTFDRVSAVVKDPAAFLRRVSFRAANTEKNAAEEFEMADGRFISRYMTPLIAANGDYLGRAAFYTDITERKTAAQKQQFTNTLLRTQMEASPDGIMVVDANWELVSCNQRLVKILNLGEEHLQAGGDDARRAHIIAQGAEPEADMARIKYLLDHPDEIGQDELLMKDGRIIERFSRTLMSPTGEQLGRVWYFNDVTGRKTAERKLQFTNILLSTQMEASPDGILVVDANRDMVSCNQRFSEIWRMPAEMIERGGDDARRAHILSQVVSPEIYKARIDYLVEHPEAIGEEEILTTDGRTLERFSQSLVSPAGEYLGRVWFFGDVTERKLAEKKLMLSNALLKTQLEASPDGIYVVGKDREVLSYNQRFINMWSLSEPEMLAAKRGWLRQEVGKMLRDPEPFIAGIAHLNLHPNETADDVLETIDGRTIEQHSVALLAQDKELGRAWFYRDITARRAAESLTLRLARYDVLTGLANRALFVEAVNQAIAHAGRDGTGFAVLFLDLDHFKDVNDTLGHPAGDALLKGVAARLKGATRETDTVGRFGGDEFAVILSGVQDAAGAGVLAEKLITAINIPMTVELSTIHVRASIGIELFSASAPDSETLLGHADVALYRAKAEGRGTFRFFTAEMDRDVRSRVTLGAELRKALAAGEFFLLYQPQVEATTGRMTGLEALIRWRHPTRGILLPEIFISAAETAGAIAQLGHFVLWATCRQAAAWRDAGLEIPRISFNLSALQFKGSIALEADIAEALAKYALPARVLELELTESVLMDTSRENNDILRRLKARGIKLAIDDFGTGYSSLEYLRRFPADHIKIAQTFTKNIETEASDATIVRAIIGLASELNIATIAEGIETRAQMDLIASWGCTQMQGFYFSPPVPAESITATLSSGVILLPNRGSQNRSFSFDQWSDSTSGCDESVGNVSQSGL